MKTMNYLSLILSMFLLSGCSGSNIYANSNTSCTKEVMKKERESRIIDRPQYVKNYIDKNSLDARGFPPLKF